MRQAKHKVWLTEDRKKLVPDEHPEAAFLFARKGQEMPDHEVAHLPNADDHFTGGKSVTKKEEKVADNYGKTQTKSKKGK